MTRASRTRGPSNQPRPTTNLPPNPVPVPGSVPPVAVSKREIARTNRKPRYGDLRGEERRSLLERVNGLAKSGHTVDEIAAELGVQTKMLMRWCSEDRVFFEALNPDWQLKAARVEDALYKRAVGYIAQTVTTKTVSKAGSVPETHVTTKVEHVAPDPTSAILFLEVYKPDVYKRDKNNLLVINNNATDHQQNPRGLAMALLAILREAAQTTIDLKPEPAE